MRKRWLGWIALTLGWTLAHADDPLDQPVRYDQPARTVKQLLADLSRQTGVTLFAPSPIDAEIVLVSVQDMPLKTLMEHLATVTDAEWFKQPNGSYHLVRTPKRARERREQDNAQILAGLQRDLKRKELEPLLEPLTEAQLRQTCEQIKRLMQEIEAQEIHDYWAHPLIRSLEEQVGQLNTGQRLIIRLVRQLDLRRLLEIPVGERRVFSNVRGRYLVPFGFEVRSLLEQYQREARLVYQVWTHPIDGVDAQRVEQFNERYEYVIEEYRLRREPPQSPLTRLYLVVRRDSTDGFTFNIVLVSEDLKQSAEAGYWSLWFRKEKPEEGDSGSGSKLSQPEASQKPAVRVEWSELSRQFIEAYRTIERTAEPIAFADVLDPAKVEPLSLAPTDVLRTYASQKGKPVIALIPDGQIRWLVRAVRGGDTLQEYQEWLRWGIELQEREEVILFKPRWSSYWWGQRTDRLALSRWLRQLHQRGYPKLEDYLALLQMDEQSGFGSWMVLNVYKDLILLWDNVPLGDQDSRFLNRLSAKQLDHLRAGGKLTLRELSPVQREQLLHDIYFGSSILERVFSASEQPTAPFEDEEKTEAVSLPHVFYPDGLPDDITIQLNSTHSDIFYSGELLSDIADSQYAGEIGIFTARSAGIWQGFRSIVDIACDIHAAENLSEEEALDEDYVRFVQERANHYKTTSLMPVHRKPFRLEVRLGRHHAVYLPSGFFTELYDFELLNEGKAVTLDTLPDKLKSVIEKCLKWLKEQRSSESGDGG
jgi:hypothetical protein